MTNHWNDIANSDCVMIIGCNPAENHPVSFKWITKAMDQGAKLIVVDPRFTRSAAKANQYVRLRPGTDIALMGGFINYAGPEQPVSPGLCGQLYQCRFPGK